MKVPISSMRTGGGGENVFRWESKTGILHSSIELSLELVRNLRSKEAKISEEKFV